MASDGIMLTINYKGELAEFKEPYAEILVEIEDALNIVKRLENIIKEKGIVIS